MQTTESRTFTRSECDIISLEASSQQTQRIATILACESRYHCSPCRIQHIFIYIFLVHSRSSYPLPWLCLYVQKIQPLPSATASISRFFFLPTSLCTDLPRRRTLQTKNMFFELCGFNVFICRKEKQIHIATANIPNINKKNKIIWIFHVCLQISDEEKLHATSSSSKKNRYDNNENRMRTW